jgi:hypothetical protein
MLKVGDVAFVLGGVLMLVWAFVGVAGVCRMSPKDLVTLQALEEVGVTYLCHNMEKCLYV